MKKLLFGLTLFLLPVVVFGAGFAKQSLFLSKSSVVEGDTVLIHSSVSNDTTTKFAGTLVLKDSATVIGNVPVALAPGEAGTLSVSWKPSAGSHAGVAQLQAKDGTVVEEESAVFTIAAKPVPVEKPSAFKENQPAAIVESSAGIQEGISRLSPAVAQGAQPVFAAIDSARSAAAEALDQGIDYEKGQIAKNNKGQVLGEQTDKASLDTTNTKNWTNTLWNIIDTLVLYILTIFRWFVGNAGIFYPAVALLFLWFLWKLYKRMRRPR